MIPFDSDCLIITPNQRLARVLRSSIHSRAANKLHDSLKQSPGHCSKERPSMASELLASLLVEFTLSETQSSRMGPFEQHPNILPANLTTTQSPSQTSPAFSTTLQQVSLQTSPTILTSFETPPILAYDNFLKQTWSTHTASSLNEQRQLLSSQQMEALWSRIVQQEGTPDHSKTALQTWELLKHWCIALDNPDLISTTAGLCFLLWAELFKKECQRNHWIDESMLAQIISEEPEITKKIKYRKIILVNFLEFTPAQKKLWRSLESQDFEIQEIHQENISESAYKIEFQNETDEIKTIARWAKALVDDGQDSIACVFPELKEQRDKISSIFEEVFDGLPTLHNTHTDSPYNISAGLPLKNHAFIQETLLLLELTKPTLSINTINSILKSPLLKGAQNEMMPRCQLYERLCRDNVLELTLEKLLEYTKTSGFVTLTDAPVSASVALSEVRSTKSNGSCFYNLLTAFKIKITDIQLKKYPPSNWAPIISDLLKTLGWPGDSSLSSAEYQLANRFLSLLSELAHFDTIDKTISLSQALHRLQQLATSTIFQFQTKKHAIEILGVLEASGMQFKHAWVANMSERIWPPVAKPNPFIPKKFQREQKMPHSSPQRELEFCEHLTKEFQENSQHIIFSFSKQIDGREHHESPLIADIPRISLLDLPLSKDDSLIKKIFHARALESFNDDYGTPLSLKKSSEGGTAIFKDQASCPFKAYAHHRLQAKSFDLPQPGLTAAQRGSMVHEILELLWGELQSQEKLLSLSDSDLESLTQKYINQVLQKNINPRTKFYLLEQERLSALMHSWLTLEKTRELFVVTGREVPLTSTINDLTINMRADRIDTLHDGSTIIIDYKTNQPSIQSWFGDRPDEPQLPLYCMSTQPAPGAIAFAQIHALKVSYKGVSADEMILSDITPIERMKLWNAGKSAALQPSPASLYLETLSEVSHPRGLTAGSTNFSMDPAVKPRGYPAMTSFERHPGMVPAHTLNQPLTWHNQLQQWTLSFNHLAQEYKDGLASVTPKSIHTSCLHCDLHSLCRIHEHGDIIDE